MRTINYKSQSAEAVNSAVAKIFANVSVNEVAQKITKKLIKTKNAQGLKGLSAFMEIRVSDDYRVKVDAAVFDYGRYIVNVMIEKKNGNRFMDFGTKKHYDGENINLISFSQIFADVEAAMYEIVDNELYYTEKHGITMSELPKKYNYYLNEWEELTGLNFAEVVMGVEPMPESEDSAEVTEEDVINEVVGVINANLIENYTEGQKLDWSLFNDSTMEYLFANGGPELYGKIITRVTQISDCLAYDDCFYVWYDEEPVKNEAPKLDKYNVIAHCADGDIIIGKNGVYDVTLDVAKEIADAHKNMGVELSIVKVEEIEDTLTYENVKFFAEQYDIHMGCDGKYVLPRGIAQNNWDEYLTFDNVHLEYTKEYWDKFWKIYCNVMCDLWKEEYEVVVDNCYDRLIFTPMIDENDALASEEIEEIVENALESAMDDGEEYYDDIICQVGNWYVNYTSPCDEFPKGCVCVVDEDGRLYGDWCNVSDSGFAVDHLVETIEKCIKMFNNVA